MHGVVYIAVSSELALYVLVAEQPHLLGQVFAVAAKDPAE